MEPFLDLESCLALLAGLAEQDGKGVMAQLDAAVDQHLGMLGDDPKAETDALIGLIAAFIAQGRSTPLRDAMVDHLTLRYLSPSKAEIGVPRPMLRDAVKRLIERLEASGPNSTRLSQNETPVVVAALRGYLSRLP